jgi:type IV pilus assembly protein PilF
LCQQKRYTEAETRFVKATENPLYANAAQAFENTGMCMLRANELEKAETYFRKALQKHKALPKSLIQMANLLYDQSEYSQASQYVERYKVVADWRPQSLLTAIKVANKLGDQDTVASYILLLKAKFPDSDEAGIVTRGEY